MANRKHPTGSQRLLRGKIKIATDPRFFHERRGGKRGMASISANMAPNLDDVRSERALDELQRGIQKFLEAKRREGGFKGGVCKGAVRPLKALAFTLPDPFVGITVNPIQEVR